MPVTSDHTLSDPINPCLGATFRTPAPPRISPPTRPGADTVRHTPGDSPPSLHQPHNLHVAHTGRLAMNAPNSLKLCIQSHVHIGRGTSGQEYCRPEAPRLCLSLPARIRHMPRRAAAREQCRPKRPLCTWWTNQHETVQAVAHDHCKRDSTNISVWIRAPRRQGCLCSHHRHMAATAATHQ